MLYVSTIGQIMRFFSNPHKPMILALARPDPKKNLTTLLKAFGERQALRELANLVCCCSVLSLFSEGDRKNATASKEFRK